MGTVLVTVGTLMILSDLTAKAAGATQRNIPLRLPALEFGEIVVSSTQMLILGGIVVLTIVMHLLLKHTWFGRAVRAVTQDGVGAQICGVRSVHMKALTFAFGSATVAVAAVLYVLSFPVDPYMGFGLTVKAFTIIVVGGIGNLPGALLAGVFLGVAEGLTACTGSPSGRRALSVIAMLLILVVWPKGPGEDGMKALHRLPPLLGLGLVAALAALPFSGNAYLTTFAFTVLIAYILGQSWDWVAGEMGYVNLGHYAFYGIGAYAFAIVLVGGSPFWLAFVAALGVTALPRCCSRCRCSACTATISPSHRWRCCRCWRCWPTT